MPPKCSILEANVVVLSINLLRDHFCFYLVCLYNDWHMVFLDFNSVFKLVDFWRKLWMGYKRIVILSMAVSGIWTILWLSQYPCLLPICDNNQATNIFTRRFSSGSWYKPFTCLLKPNWKTSRVGIILLFLVARTLLRGWADSYLSACTLSPLLQ